MTLREQIESLAESVEEECSSEDAHEDTVSKLAGRVDELSRDLIEAIANGDVLPGDVQAFCAMVRDMNDAISEAMEGF